MVMMDAQMWWRHLQSKLSVQESRKSWVSDLVGEVHWEYMSSIFC
jgi:hypothetical protein